MGKKLHTATGHTDFKVFFNLYMYKKVSKQKGAMLDVLRLQSDGRITEEASTGPWAWLDAFLSRKACNCSK